MIAFRYLVSDVDAARAFYIDKLGFRLVHQWGPAFAEVERDGVRLWLAGPQASAARAMPDGRKPVPGGWNRVVLIVSDLESMARALREAGVAFRSDIIRGPGGSQALVEDGSGNVVELFEPRE